MPAVGPLAAAVMYARFGGDAPMFAPDGVNTRVDALRERYAAWAPAHLHAFYATSWRNEAGYPMANLPTAMRVGLRAACKAAPVSAKRYTGDKGPTFLCAEGDDCPWCDAATGTTPPCRNCDYVTLHWYAMYEVRHMPPNAVDSFLVTLNMVRLADVATGVLPSLAAARVQAIVDIMQTREARQVMSEIGVVATQSKRGPPKELADQLDSRGKEGVRQLLAAPVLEDGQQAGAKREHEGGE